MTTRLLGALARQASARFQRGDQTATRRWKIRWREFARRENARPDRRNARRRRPSRSGSACRLRIGREQFGFEYGAGIIFKTAHDGRIESRLRRRQRQAPRQHRIDLARVLQCRVPSSCRRQRCRARQALRRASRSPRGRRNPSTALRRRSASSPAPLVKSPDLVLAAFAEQVRRRHRRRGDRAYRSRAARSRRASRSRPSARRCFASTPLSRRARR